MEKKILSADAILQNLGKTDVPFDVVVVQQTASTNQDLLDGIEGLQKNTALIAVTQTSGRGRNGHTWYSYQGASLTFSLAWQFSKPAYLISGIPLVVGVAIAQVLKDLDISVSLKWPNDLLRDGKKLGGILVELPRNGYKQWAIIGVGINLVMPDELEQKIDQPVASVPWLAQMNRNVLIAKLIKGLSANLTALDVEGFTKFMPIWESLHAFQGKEIVITDSLRKKIGVVSGIDSHGRLLVDTGSGITAVATGDVSIRLKQEFKHYAVD